MKQQNLTDILIIRSDHSAAHLYGDRQELLHSTAPGRAGDAATFEFFTKTGQRLAPVFDSKWHLVDLLPTADHPKPELVLQKLRATVANMRAYLRDNQDLVENAGLTVEDGLALLPNLRVPTLDLALDTWSKVFGHPGQTDVADPWHNFWVHGIL